jgi:hypothetical protein
MVNKSKFVKTDPDSSELNNMKELELQFKNIKIGKEVLNKYRPKVYFN